MAAPHRHSPARTVALACVTLIVLAILTLSGLACFEWGRASEGKSQADRTNLVGGCRAAYRAELVDLPTYRALRALGAKDDTALQDALRSADLDRYQELIDLSQADAGRFVRQCRKDGHAG